MGNVFCLVGEFVWDIVFQKCRRQFRIGKSREETSINKNNLQVSHQSIIGPITDKPQRDDPQNNHYSEEMLNNNISHENQYPFLLPIIQENVNLNIEQLDPSIQNIIRGFDLSFKQSDLVQCQEIHRNLKQNLRDVSIQQIEQIQGYFYPKLALLTLKVRMPDKQNYFAKAISFYEQNPGTWIQEHITFLDNIASILLIQYKLTKGERVLQLYQQALQLSKKYLLKNDPKHFYLMNNLMCAYFEMGKFQKGEECFKKSTNLLRALESFDTLQQIKRIIQENYQMYFNKQGKINVDQIGLDDQIQTRKNGDKQRSTSKGSIRTEKLSIDT